MLRPRRLSWTTSLLSKSSLVACVGVVLGATFAGSPPAVLAADTTQSGWTERVLYGFPPARQLLPVSPNGGLLLDKLGALYGTTMHGGSCPGNLCGTVFRLAPPTRGATEWTETVLHSFDYENVDGYFPQAGLFATPRGLFGTTLHGGDQTNNCDQTYNGCGTVFELTAPAPGQRTWNESVLYTFQGGWGTLTNHGYVSGSADAGLPYAALVSDASGALYGTTSNGGATVSPNCALPGPEYPLFLFGCGAVFKLTPPVNGESTWHESVIYSFTNTRGDGWLPQAGLIEDAEGRLYGTTSSGGDKQSRAGIVFALTPPRSSLGLWAETILWNFRGPDGAEPSSPLVADAGGNLYGTTEYGGSANCPQFKYGCGVVFKLTPPRPGCPVWAETVLYSFNGTKDGIFPTAGLVRDGHGALYGVAAYGGTGPCNNANAAGCGTIFKLTPPISTQHGAAWTETTLHTFVGSDGAYPSQNLTIDAQGNLYGATPIAGPYGNGTIFELSPPGTASILRKSGG